MSVVWNLWHGCKKISEGCANCYMFRSDAKFGRDSLDIHKTQSFNLPIRRGQNGNYKMEGRSKLCLKTNTETKAVSTNPKPAQTA